MFQHNGQTIQITNTCSIDYFLIILAIVNNRKNDTWSDEKWNSEIIDIIVNNVIEKKIDQARLFFIQHFNHIKKIQNNSNRIIYDCFLAEYDSYYKIFEKNQLYEWKTTCTNKLCILSRETRGNSSSFIFYR